MRVFLNLILSFALGVVAHGSEPDWVRVHELNSQAADLLYKCEFAQAEARCYEAMKLAPKDPRGYFMRSMIYYYRYITSGEDSVYKRYLGTIGAVTRVCEANLQANENDHKAMLYLGGSIGYKGLVRYFRKEDMMSAVLDGKKAYSLLEQSLKIDPSNGDAQMGLGLFNYLISRAPSSVRSILKVAGLSGEKDKGLEQLEYAAKNGLYTKNEAKRWLADFYRGEENQAKAFAHLRDLTRAFPTNPYFNEEMGDFQLLTLRKSDLALGFYAKMLSYRGEYVERVQESARFNLGLCKLYKTDFDGASQEFERGVELKLRGRYENALKYYGGLANELAGRRNRALELYRLCPPDYSDVAKRISQGIDQSDSCRLVTEYLFRSGAFDRAVSHAESAIGQGRVKEIHKPLVHFFAGRACYESKDYPRALKHLGYASAYVGSEYKDWLKPWSIFYMGLANTKSGNPDQARQAFDQVLSMNDFQNEDYLKRRSRGELSRLR